MTARAPSSKSRVKKKITCVLAFPLTLGTVLRALRETLSQVTILRLTQIKFSTSFSDDCGHCLLTVPKEARLVAAVMWEGRHWHLGQRLRRLVLQCSWLSLGTEKLCVSSPDSHRSLQIFKSVTKPDSVSHLNTREFACFKTDSENAN